jgi:hypothetical protein
MYLIIRKSDNVIIGNISYISKVSALQLIEQSYGDNYSLIEIPNEEFQEGMIGAIYMDGEDVDIGSPIELPVEEEEVIIFPPMPSFGSPTGIK